jgi:hypothetical protein
MSGPKCRLQGGRDTFTNLCSPGAEKGDQRPDLTRISRTAKVRRVPEVLGDDPHGIQQTFRIDMTLWRESTQVPSQALRQKGAGRDSVHQDSSGAREADRFLLRLVKAAFAAVYATKPCDWRLVD